MTPTSVGLVLVEGQDADGATMDRSAFDVRHEIHTSEQAAEAVRQAEALAAAHGLRLHSIGVTWSEDSDAEASRLMGSLSDGGYDNVVAVRMPEATEALARGMAAVSGYQTTAVCVVEPETAMTLIVHGGDGAVQTAFNHGINSDVDLINWLSTVFIRADWQPEALVVVGSAGGFTSILPDLELALSVPVFAPEEAELALARGAALASAQSLEGPLDLDDGFRAFGAVGAQRRRTPADRLAAAGPAAMLVVGAMTFVVSVSLAVSMQLSPRSDPGASEPVNAAVNAPQVRSNAPQAPVSARAKPPEARPPAPAAPPPPPEAPALPEAPAVDAALPEAPYVPEAPVINEVPAAPPVYPELAPPPEVPALAPPPVVAQVPAMPPPVVSSPYPTKKPGILTRIRDKLRIGDDNPPPPPVMPPAVTVYPGG
jgi:hypothetical protein